MSEDHDASDRGREAEKPTEIPRPGWRDILIRTAKQVSEDQVSILAGSVAYSSMLALFPALIAAVSVYGLVADPVDVQQQIASLTALLPASAADLFSAQLSQIVSTRPGSLTTGFVVSIAVALWSASGGMATLIAGTNVAFEETETRKFLKLRGLALLLTLGAIIGLVLALGAIVVVPLVLEQIGLGTVGQAVVSVLRWPLLALVVIVGLAVLYRYGPDRKQPKWRWVSPGSVVATLLWLVASGAFSFYVNNFGSYNKTYGALGAVIVLLLWLFITGFVILMGAELDSEIEHQTYRDTTAGEDQPRGQRDAHVADNVADAPGVKEAPRDPQSSPDAERPSGPRVARPA